ncbi:MAG: C39 family peptidase [Bacteroidales bacterium]|nr:C39 family peptidase [Lentimicrobiaceae bacterium]MDD5695982.1 C39 family peptidase [Bacteroidales bacterium]
MLRSNRILIVIILILTSIGCEKNDHEMRPDTPAAIQYYVLNIRPSHPIEGLLFLNVDSYQQTTEYTCGPAAVVSFLKYYGIQRDEMTLAEEMGTSSTVGTTPEQISTWLNKNGFTASWHQEGSLEMLQENLANNIPTLVEWSDWGGHWVLVIGYDIRDPEDVMDDVIIFADPYDRHDDHQDGITWFNAQRFYYMWYDALLFGSVMKRTYIRINPPQIRQDG